MSSERKLLKFIAKQHKCLSFITPFRFIETGGYKGIIERRNGLESESEFKK